MTVDQKLSLLRQKMKENDVDALIVPSSDSHQSEYVAPYWQSREWISGFTGSAGTAVITLDHAGVWTDSRYYLQAEEELSDSEFVLHKVINYSPDFVAFLLDQLQEGDTVACDGKVFSKSEIDAYQKSFGAQNIEVNVSLDLVGMIWEDRPPLPQEPIFSLDVKYAGKSIVEKLEMVRLKMKEHQADSYLLTALDDIAWLFNLRGKDIAYNPVFYAFAIVEQDEAILFVDPVKISFELKQELGASGVRFVNYEGIYDHLALMPQEYCLMLSPSGVNYYLYQQISCQVEEVEAYVTAFKAIKNEVEIAHFRKVMEKDAVALTRVYRWLDDRLEAGETVTEYALAEKLAGFRSELPGYYGESFGAIAGYRGNGAIVHYSPKKDASAVIKKEGILLLDSGGQYEDGTTDITRTVAMGPVTREQQKHFTLVLKGCIALDQLEFPEGTNGYQLDAFARQYLWKYGLNYFHGTGHGVGFFLNVHEGPHGISFVYSSRSNRPMQPGMVTSNEPGFYLEGQYGIRVENLILTKVTRENEFGKFLGHETLTLFPIDQAMIDTDLLSKEELVWLDNYHQMVYDRVSPHLNEDEKSWLKEKCKALSRK
jgi:Xaa-Pro aminopeptidase